MMHLAMALASIGFIAAGVLIYAAAGNHHMRRF